MTQQIRLTLARAGLGTKLYLRAAGFRAPNFDKYFEADADLKPLRKPSHLLSTEPRTELRDFPAASGSPLVNDLRRCCTAVVK